MGNRGPASLAERSVRPLTRSVPKAPSVARLPAAAARVYCELVGSATEPLAAADGPLLEALAVCVVRLRDLEPKVLEGDEGAHRQFLDLCRLAAVLATKARVASSSTRRPASSRSRPGPVQSMDVLLRGRHAD
jgi:hypothetical protein